MKAGEFMKKEVKISYKELVYLKNKIEMNSKLIDNNTKSLEKYINKLEEAENVYKLLPITLEEAIKKSLTPIMDKLLTYDKKFHELELEKETTKNEYYKRIIEEQKEKKKYFNRMVMSCIVTSIVSGILSFYLMSILNWIHR